MYLFVLAWIVLSYIPAIQGRRRRGGFWGWFFLSILISPPLAMVCLYLAKEQRRRVTDRGKQSPMVSSRG